ncbi:PEB3 protein, partial [Acromyrmex insinuator]
MNFHLGISFSQARNQATHSQRITYGRRNAGENTESTLSDCAHVFLISGICNPIYELLITLRCLHVVCGKLIPLEQSDRLETIAHSNSPPDNLVGVTKKEKGSASRDFAVRGLWPSRPQERAQEERFPRQVAATARTYTHHLYHRRDRYRLTLSSRLRSNDAILNTDERPPAFGMAPAIKRASPAIRILILACTLLATAMATESDSEGQQSGRSRVSDEQLNVALSDKRYLNRQLKCALGEAPCDPVGRRLKSLVPLVLRGSCPQCSPEETRQIKKVLSHIQRSFPKEWNRIVQQYAGVL